MLRAVACCAAIFAAVLITCAAAFAGTRGKPVGTFNGCPAGLRVLPTNPAGWRPAARQAASIFLKTTFARWNKQRHWGIRLAGAYVGEPFLVRHWLPSGWIKSECGLAVWQRSVWVNVTFPAMEYPNPKGPCNSCAQEVLLLGDTRHGWITWGSYS